MSISVLGFDLALDTLTLTELPASIIEIYCKLIHEFPKAWNGMIMKQFILNITNYILMFFFAINGVQF